VSAAQAPSLPVFFRVATLLDEQVEVSGSYTLERELDEPIRGFVYIAVEGCGLETRIDTRLASGVPWKPVNYYKPPDFQGRVYWRTFGVNALSYIRVSANGTGTLRVRVYNARPVYRIDAVPAGSYELVATAEPLPVVERTIDLSNAEQFDIVYEYVPGVLAGIENAYPPTAASIEVTALDEQVTLLHPLQPDDMWLTPCKKKYDNTLGAWRTLTIDAGRTIILRVNDYMFYHLAFYAGGGRLLVREHRIVPRARLVKLG